MNKLQVLVVEDEPQIRKLLEINLQNNDFKVLFAQTAHEGIALTASHNPDLVLLDLGLPDKNGLEVLTELREWYTKPILILSVQNSETNIVQALDLGANDYLTKPFRMGELMARIRTAIRNNQRDETQQVILSGTLQINLANRTVTKNNEALKLTPTEYKLLILLAKNGGRVLTHQFILKEVWGVGFQTDTQYLRVFVGQLRKKIEENPNQPAHIITESGVGYRFP